jgi:hypothetical protein
MKLNKKSQSNYSYELDTKCTNCNWSGVSMIPKGLKFDIKSVYIICPNCRCDTLIKKYETR